VTVLGPIGAGKSSVIAYVCSQLPETHIALRVPVAGADDPTSLSVVAAVALSQALNDLDLEKYQQEALESARADRVSRERTPGGLRGGKLGGGAVPAEVHAELGTLRRQVETDALATERLAGLERLIQILVERGREPIFVIEDTEAAVGSGEPHMIDGFFDGPIRAFTREVRAPCLIAVQDHIAASSSVFQELAPSMQLVRLPEFDQSAAGRALSTILRQRLEDCGVEFRLDETLSDEALELAVDFYEDSQCSIRHTLAALHTASEHAADARAERIGPGHVRAAIAEWRTRLPNVS
jgi:hypothetical protein